MKEPETEQQKDFIDAYVTSGDVASAAHEAGYASIKSCYAILRKYKDYTLDCMAHKLMLAGPKAISKLTHMLDDGASEVGATTRMEAAKQVLDRIGLIKKEKIEIETAQGGIFILPPKVEAKE